MAYAFGEKAIVDVCSVFGMQRFVHRLPFACSLAVHQSNGVKYFDAAEKEEEEKATTHHKKSTHRRRIEYGSSFN